MKSIKLLSFILAIIIIVNNIDSVSIANGYDNIDAEMNTNTEAFIDITTGTAIEGLNPVENIEENNITTPSAIDIEIPVELPINVLGDGTVNTYKDIKIVNNGDKDVVITDIKITGLNGWRIVAYSNDMSNINIGSKVIGFKINGFETDESGKLNLGENESLKIRGNYNLNNWLEIDYDAKVPAQKVGIDSLKIADIVFLIECK